MAYHIYTLKKRSLAEALKSQFEHCRRSCFPQQFFFQSNANADYQTLRFFRFHFRISEKVSTPTSIILMATNSFIGKNISLSISLFFFSLSLILSLSLSLSFSLSNSLSIYLYLFLSLSLSLVNTHILLNQIVRCFPIHN